MNAPVSVDDLRHEEIRRWLEPALHGREPLPLLTRDEFPHLGILRLEKTLKPATRDSLREGALQLVRRFCADGQGETAYMEELLALAEQELARLNMGIEQARQREVDAADLVEIERVVERAQAAHLVLGQRQRRVGAELRPSLGGERPVRGDVGEGYLVHRHFHDPGRNPRRFRY